MIVLTKIFHFEMAHAIEGYIGACKNIHGHSYELHVTVSSKENQNEYIQGLGMEIDFKEIKQKVKTLIIEKLDHALVLSKTYMDKHPNMIKQENLLIWEIEPTAENILIYIMKILTNHFSNEVKLVKLKLYETKDSYAEWFPA